MATPVGLYPAAPTLTFGKNAKLDNAVAEAAKKLADAGRPAQFSLAIIDLGGGGTSETLGWGAHKPDEMHYTASAAKAGAMYAAFALKDMVTRFATMSAVFRAAFAAASTVSAPLMPFGGLLNLATPPPKPAPLFDSLRKEMDPEIDKTAHPLLQSAVQRIHRVPNYPAMFGAPPAGGGPPADFAGTFRTALHEMIVPSSNEHAGMCVRGVGYGYLNGALTAAGLFKDKTGIWLAGDYVSRWPYARIDSANDAGVAQAGTALSMARLMALIANDGIIDKNACEAMRKLMAKATRGPDQPFVTRDVGSAGLAIPLEKVTHAKLGFGPLKKGGNVCSELFRLQGVRNASKAYAVAFQNLNENQSPLADVNYMLLNAITTYEA